MFKNKKSNKAAFNAGKLAFSNGKSLSDNPYVGLDNVKELYWNKGWHENERVRNEFTSSLNHEEEKRKRKQEKQTRRELKLASKRFYDFGEIFTGIFQLIMSVIIIAIVLLIVVAVIKWAYKIVFVN